jgi:class 3 adenylate cyclase/tetratricopeptide (TPR) repeat protein
MAVQGRVPTTGAAPLAGERKPVTALFADLVGSTSLAESLDPEDWAHVVNGMYEAATQAITRYEGTVTQLSGDAVVAIFGAPVAHEDDPERAVRAGLDLISAIGEVDVGVDLEVRVGVNTGLAVVGSVGSSDHEEYTALGDAMNVAARIQSAARPGTLLITEATRERLGDLVEVVDRGALEVKGKSQPVTAYEVTSVAGRAVSTRGIPGLESPMVGRGDELGRLMRVLDVVRAGRGRTALVLGEPGIGKSRLLAEVRSRLDGVRWVVGRCLSYGGALPHHLVIDLIVSMTDHEDDLSADAVQHMVREVLGGEAEAAGEVAGHLCHLAGLPTPTELGEQLADLDPTAVHRRHVDALTEVLLAMANRSPIVLVCEDLHWADASSVDMLIELTRVIHGSPVLLLATARPERESEGWRFVTQVRSGLGDALTELNLEPLSLDDSRSLVAHLLEIESLRANVRHLILERTDGNPFFVEEVIRALIDDGLITRHGDRWIASGDLRAVDVPETIHGLLLGRIDRLPDGARRTLRIASVLGRTFTPDLLGYLVDDPADVLAALGTLEAHGLITIASTRPDITYSFRHALVREAAYGGLLHRERRSLHRQVAEVLEAQHAEHPEEVSALLAHHLDLAEEHERAIPYLLDAARRAVARYANREAHVLFARAGDLLDRATDVDAVRRRIEARVGEVQAGATFIPGGDQLALLEAVLPAAEQLGDEHLVAQVHVWIAWALNYIGERERPELHASIERALELGEGFDDASLVYLPLRVRGELHYGTGRYRAAIADLARAVDLAERREQLADAAMSAGTVAICHARLGEFAEADRWIARSGELARRSGDPNAILDVDLYRGVVETERGNLEEAMVHTRRAIDQANEVGNIDCALVGNFWLGDQHLRRGDADGAIVALEQSGELAAFCDAGSLASLSEAWLAVARARAGADPAAQLAAFDTPLRAARASGDAHGEAEIHRHRATLRAAQADPDLPRVIDDFGAAVSIFERLEAGPALARTLHDYGMALEAAGRSAEAVEALERAAALSEDMGLVPAER